MAQRTPWNTSDMLLAAFRASSDAMVLCDTEGSIRFWNNAATGMFGISAEEAMNDSFFHLMDECISFLQACATRTLQETMRPANGQTGRSSLVNQRVTVRSRTEPDKISFALLTVDRVYDTFGAATGVMAILKDNTAVEMLTRTDSLTGVANRREFDEKIAREYERLQRGHMNALSLLFLDGDDFGKINKMYDHTVGDQILRLVGDVLNGTRALDSAARFADPGRYGGEEFCLILPGTDSAGALQVAERLRERLAQISVRVHGTDQPLHMTVSIGIATHSPVDKSDTLTLIKEANNAMLQAKRSGKNRCVAYGHAKVA